MQGVLKLRDVPIATAVTLFYQILGATIFAAIGQTVLLNKFLPGLQEINPSLTITDIIQAGATGVRNLVPVDQLPGLLAAYAKGLDASFIVAVAMAATSTLLGLGIEWKNMKKNKKPNGKSKSSKAAEPKESRVL